MFSSIAAAPASCMARAYSVQPSGVTPFRLAITGMSTEDGGALEQGQVGARSAVLLGHRGEVAERLGEALGGLLDEPDGSRGLLAQLLLEQREQHDRADASVGQPPDAVEAVRQRRRGRHERVAQGQAHVVGGEVHQLPSAGSDGNSLALRVAISS